MKRIVLIWIVLVAMIGGSLASCSSSRNAYNRDDIYGDSASHHKKPKKKPQKPSRTDRPSGTSLTGNVKDVIDEAYSMLGTPYKYGGNSKDGIDCSGLTCMVFDRATGIKLPRNSGEQADYTRRIKRSELQPGDLVFFVSRKGGSRINHVAIYVGDNSVIHSTTSQGVVVSSLDEDYWQTHFYSCGRVL